MAVSKLRLATAASWLTVSVTHPARHTPMRRFFDPSRLLLLVRHKFFEKSLVLVQRDLNVTVLALKLFVFFYKCLDVGVQMHILGLLFLRFFASRPECLFRIHKRLRRHILIILLLRLAEKLHFLLNTIQ